jgi:hypothetical protein
MLTGAWVCAALSHQNDHQSPEENANSHDLLCRESANEPTAGVLSEEVTGVNHCGTDVKSVSSAS